MSYSNDIVNLWRTSIQEPNTFIDGTSLPFADSLRSLLFLGLKNGNIKIDEVAKAAATIGETGEQPIFLWSLVQREGKETPKGVVFSPIEVDSFSAKLNNPGDVEKAIQFHSQGILSNYQFGEKDLPLLPVAINNADLETVKRLLPFSNSLVTVPTVGSKFPILNQVYRKIEGVVYLHNETVKREKIAEERLKTIK